MSYCGHDLHLLLLHDRRDPLLLHDRREPHPEIERLQMMVKLGVTKNLRQIDDPA